MGRGFLGGRGSDFESTGVSLINKCTVKRMEGRFFLKSYRGRGAGGACAHISYFLAQHLFGKENRSQTP